MSTGAYIHVSYLGIGGLVVAELVAGLVCPGSCRIRGIVLWGGKVLNSVCPAGILAYIHTYIQTLLETA